MIIYAGIDGTSSEDNDSYEITFENSFVNRLKKETFTEDPFYHRGPFISGVKTAQIAEDAYKYVVASRARNPEAAVFLAGYSRGAAAVIEVASWLKKRLPENPIPVECLILFDAVDRSHTIGNTISDSIMEYLPANLRGPFTAYLRSYLQKFDFLGGIGSNTMIPDTVGEVIYAQRQRFATGSRLTFQNCGFRVENPGMPFIHQQFYATHGGMGGTPWKKAVQPYLAWLAEQAGTTLELDIPTIWELGEINPTTLTPAMDAAGSASVWGWAYPQIFRAKVECELRLETSPGASPGVGAPAVPTNPNLPNPPGNPPLKPGERLHIVKSGDWLSRIAVTYYGDMKKWEKIYTNDWNKKEIGHNPDLIKPGMRLVIPA